MADLASLTLRVEKSADWLRFNAVVIGIATDDRFGGWAQPFVDRLQDMLDGETAFRVMAEHAADGTVLHCDLTDQGRDWLADIIAAMPADLAKGFAPVVADAAKGFAPGGAR